MTYGIPIKFKRPWHTSNNIRAINLSIFYKFIKSQWSLVIIAGGRILFRSKASAIKPLIKYLKSDKADAEEVTIYDKYVGRAAALLMVRIKPVLVRTPVISEGGAEVFEKFGVPYRAQRRVKYLMGVASDEMCRWEKMTIGKTPDEFWELLTQG